MIYIWFIAGAIVAVTLYLIFRGKKDAPLTTPKGARIVGKVGAGCLYEIDKQLDTLFEIATRNGYSGFARHKSYVFEILPIDGRCQNPAFVLDADEYDGTGWDIDPRPGYGVICAAGRFVPSTGRIQVTELGILSTDIVRYEAGHRLLFEVDRPRYEATKIHSAGNMHPIL